MQSPINPIYAVRNRAEEFWPPPRKAGANECVEASAQFDAAHAIARQVHLPY
jgi:hypothetical protein